MTCPTVIRVTTSTGPPGIGLPAGIADAGKFVRKAGSTAYAYELVTPDQVGLPQGLAASSSPTFAGLTLSGMSSSVGSLLLVGANGQLTTVLLGTNLSITAGALNASGGSGDGPALSDATPQALGAASPGTSAAGSRGDHRHAMPTAAQIGADATGTAAAAVAAHAAAADPHQTYTTAAELAVATAALSAETAGAAATLAARLNAFRDAATFYVSKRITASDSNNGTSDGEPFLTGGAAIAAAKAYVAANPGKRAKVEFGPGTYVEPSLPFRTGPNIFATASSQRTTILKPASGQEFNGFFALDSGCMVMNFTFAGHQATGTSDTDSSVGTRAWAVRFDEQANGGQGPIIYASPYIKDCLSITAEDDDGLAGSVSTGDTGGGVEIDGAKCHPSSPVRSMVVYGYTQQNLGGPGVVVKNDAYAELVSFFGLLCTWHVQCETGGWATLSGGGCSEFGTYGIVADGYSATALYTGTLRVAASAGALAVDVVSLTSNRIGSSSRPHNGQIMLIGGTGYVVTSASPINSSGTVVADSSGTRAGYRVSLYNPTGAGLVANAAQGATADFRRRSQVSAGCHTALYVGSGNNYSALPWNGGVPIRANQFVERNFGRVFGLSVNDAGDISAAGGAFAVDGTTGAVTINTSSFNLSGLNAIGPFSRNGGASTVGVQIQEASNNTSLLSSTGAVDGNTVPTQFAVAGYVSTQLQPYLLSATAASTYATLVALSSGLANKINTNTVGAANGIAPLDGSSTIPAIYLPGYVDDVVERDNLAAFPATGESGKLYIAKNPSGLVYRWSGSIYVEINPSPGSTDAVPEGSVNRYFTGARAIAATLTGFIAGAGTVAATDSILQALQKIVGNIANLLPRTIETVDVAYAATINIDFSANNGKTLIVDTLTGPLTFTFSNIAQGRNVSVDLLCDSTSRALTFPAATPFLGPKPSAIAASKAATLTFECRRSGTTDASVRAGYSVQL